MTSYQKRKQTIKYCQQCITELEFIVKHLTNQMVDNNIEIKPCITDGINGDDFITPYNNNPFIFSPLIII